MAQRYIMRIEVSAAVKRKLAPLTNRHGMTQVAMMSRLVEWQSRQSEEIQAATLGRYPNAIAPEIAKMLLKRMSD